MRLSILTAAALALVLASCGNKNCSCNCKCDGCTCAASADTTANADANNYTVVEKPQVDISKLPVDKDGYIKALEEYCDNLGDALADAEYDFEEVECENRELQDVLEKIRGVLDGKY